MMRIGKLSDYASMLMVQMSQAPERKVSAKQLAKELDLPQPTVATLLKKLGRAGLVASLRGTGGGYFLAKFPAAISLADVVSAIEGPIKLTACAIEDGHCRLERDCGARPHWRAINQSIQSTLMLTSLADMARPIARLRRMDNG
jgi:FeS assembly SUF system regulator